MHYFYTALTSVVTIILHGSCAVDKPTSCP